MLSIELLKAMDDQHAVNAVRADLDPLTNTELESFLIDWVETLLDAPEEAAFIEGYNVTEEEVVALLDSCDADADDMAAMLKTLAEFEIRNPEELDLALALLNALADEGIETPADLKNRFTRAEQFDAIAKDAGDIFQRLHQLTTDKEQQP